MSSKSTMKKCEECGEPFEPLKPWARFCSSYCRLVAHRKEKGSKKKSNAKKKKPVAAKKSKVSTVKRVAAPKTNTTAKKTSKNTKSHSAKHGKASNAVSPNKSKPKATTGSSATRKASGVSKANTKPARKTGNKVSDFSFIKERQKNIPKEVRDRVKKHMDELDKKGDTGPVECVVSIGAAPAHRTYNEYLRDAKDGVLKAEDVAGIQSLNSNQKAMLLSKITSTNIEKIK